MIGGLDFAANTCLAIDLVLFGDGAGAGNHIIETGHAFEANAEFAQCRWSHIIAQHLPYKAHNQHAVSDNAACADHFTEPGISVQRVKVA